MNSTNIVIADMKTLMQGERPIENITDEYGNECYYKDFSDDYERTHFLGQSLFHCFRDAIDELRSYGIEEQVFDLLAEVDFMTSGLDAENGHWEIMSDEIVCFEEELNKLCKEEQELMREIEEEMGEE